MVTDETGQRGFKILHRGMRADRSSRKHDSRGRTKRVAFAIFFTFRVSGCDAHPIGLGVICATGNGRAITNLSGRREL